MKNNTTGGFMSAHGKLPVPMTNDYLFHALMQENNKALIALICAVLHVNPKDIRSATIINPIIVGEHLDANKEIILDINVYFNNAAYINVEMQVIQYKNWIDRSLYYLCRNFSHLKKSNDYTLVHPSIQIDLLNFTLFDDYPEFLASYRLLNIRNHKEYSDKLQLYVLDLTQINLSTTEDKSYHIDKWAQLFKSTTWEEIQMLAQNDQEISNAASTIFDLTTDDMIRAQMQAREDYLRDQRTIEKNRRMTEEKYQKAIKDLKESKDALKASNVALKESNAALKESNAALKERDVALKERDAALNQKDAELRHLRELLAANNIPIE